MENKQLDKSKRKFRFFGLINSFHNSGTLATNVDEDQTAQNMHSDLLSTPSAFLCLSEMLLLTWPAQVHAHNSIPDNIMFGQIRLKTLADDKINMARKLNFMHGLVENIAGLLYRRKC